MMDPIHVTVVIETLWHIEGTGFLGFFSLCVYMIVLSCFLTPQVSGEVLVPLDFIPIFISVNRQNCPQTEA